jgi:hypothetical protein
MIAQARYRDLDWEQTDCPTVLNAAGLMEWEKHRGIPVSIETPSRSNLPYALKWAVSSTCNQPKYRVIGADGISVCSHIAEIGD